MVPPSAKTVTRRGVWTVGTSAAYREWWRSSVACEAGRIAVEQPTPTRPGRRVSSPISGRSIVETDPIQREQIDAVTCINLHGVLPGQFLLAVAEQGRDPHDFFS